MPETIQTEKGPNRPPLSIAENTDSPSDLEAIYVIEDRPAVASFVGENRLRTLLLEARAPLDAAFGSETVKVLQLVTDDEGFTELFGLVMWPGSVERALEARAAFDRNWWLDRGTESAGKLNFDVEFA